MSAGPRWLLSADPEDPDRVAAYRREGECVLLIDRPLRGGPGDIVVLQADACEKARAFFAIGADGRVRGSDPSVVAFRWDPVVVRVFGPDLSDLVADQIRREIGTDPRRRIPEGVYSLFAMQQAVRAGIGGQVGGVRISWRDPKGDRPSEDWLKRATRVQGNADRARVIQVHSREWIALRDSIPTDGEAPDWPERWPFPVIFLTAEHSIELTPREEIAREIFQPCASLGLLITEAGDCAELITVRSESAIKKDVRIIWWREAGQGWIDFDPILPGFLVEILRQICAIGTTLTERGSGALGPFQHPRKTHRERAIHVPPEWHPIRLQPVVRPAPEPVEPGGSLVVEREYSHRWDVRGHERVLVRRGDGPITPELERNLLRRGYRLYRPGNDISPEDDDRLRRRGLRQREGGDWLAILVTWIDPHTAGPEGAPLVQGARVVAPGNIGSAP